MDSFQGALLFWQISSSISDQQQQSRSGYMFTTANCLNSSTIHYSPLPDIAVSKVYQRDTTQTIRCLAAIFFLGNPFHKRNWDNSVKIIQGSCLWCLGFFFPLNMNRSVPVLLWKWTSTLLTWVPDLGFFWHKDCKLTPFQCPYSIWSLYKIFWAFLFQN